MYLISEQHHIILKYSRKLKTDIIYPKRVNMAKHKLYFCNICNRLFGITISNAGTIWSEKRHNNMRIHIKNDKQWRTIDNEKCKILDR